MKKLNLRKKAKNFPITNLEITSIDTGNKASNVIPNSCLVSANIRYNNSYTEKVLLDSINKICSSESSHFKLNIISSNKPFYTKPDNFSSILEKAIYKVTKKKPTLSTTGGTSDARFIKKISPCLEFGLVNKTMHKVDECVSLKDLKNLKKIYRIILEDYFR